MRLVALVIVFMCMGSGLTPAPSGGGGMPGGVAERIASGAGHLELELHCIQVGIGHLGHESEFIRLPELSRAEFDRLARVDGVEAPEFRRENLRFAVTIKNMSDDDLILARWEIASFIIRSVELFDGENNRWSIQSRVRPIVDKIISDFVLLSGERKHAFIDIWWSDLLPADFDLSQPWPRGGEPDVLRYRIGAPKESMWAMDARRIAEDTIGLPERIGVLPTEGRCVVREEVCGWGP